MPNQRVTGVAPREDGRAGSARLAVGLAVASLVTVVTSGAIAALATVAV